MFSGILEVGGFFKKGLDLQKGNKGTYWLATLLATPLTFVLALLFMLLSLAGVFLFIPKVGSVSSTWGIYMVLAWALLACVVKNLLTMLLLSGFIAMSMRVLQNEKARVSQLFTYFRGKAFLQVLPTVCLWSAVLVPAKAYSKYAPDYHIAAQGVEVFSMLFMFIMSTVILNSNLNGFTGLFASLKLVIKNLGHVIGLLVFMIISFLVGLLTLGVLFIWLVPVYYIVFGQIVKKLSGDLERSNEALMS